MLIDGVLRRPTHHLNATIEDELLVLDPASGQFHVLSHSAGLIYTAVDGMSTAADIAHALSYQFGFPLEQLIVDVATATRSMVDQGLLISDDPSSDAAGLPRLHVDLVAPTDARHRGSSVDAPFDSGPIRVGVAVVRVRSDLVEVGSLLAGPLALLPTMPSSASVDSEMSVTEPGDGGPFEVHLDGVTIASATSFDDAAEAMLAACNRVATTAPSGAVRLHGGVVSDGHRAVVLCGESGAGKSTLTAALVQAGWQYLTDEVAVIDPATSVATPYPKWLDLSTGSLQLLGLDERIGIGSTGAKHHVPPHAFGVTGGPVPVAAVVMLTGEEPGQAMQRLGPGDATRAMLCHVFATTWDHPDGLQALVDLCSHAVVVKLPRSDLAQMMSQITALLD